MIQKIINLIRQITQKTHSVSSSPSDKSSIALTLNNQTQDISCLLNASFYNNIDDPRNLELAEKYALFCFKIINGGEHIYNLIEEEIKAKKHITVQNLLFYNNVLYFLNNFIKNQYNSDSLPVIRPSSVFNIRSEIIEYSDEQ